MKANKSQIENAATIGKDNDVDIVYVNIKGEFFTNENLASLSVNGVKSKYTKIDISIIAPKETATNDLQTIDEILEQINNATLEETEAIYTAELEGKNRDAILDACEKKFETLKQ